MDTTPLTELDAVNIILRNDGEAPVASLSAAEFDEAADAQSTLQEVARTVLDGGWAFNTDYRRQFDPDVNNEIVLPTNTLWVRPVHLSGGLDVVERARKLYDLNNNTYSFTGAVYLDVCQFLDWEELPSAARYYIAVRAARLYQARGTGSPRQDSFTAEDESRAEAALRKADRRARPRGFFRNPYEARKLNRRPR